MPKGGKNIATEAVERLVGFYKGRELRLAKELVAKHGYTYRDLAKIQEIDNPKAAYQYYKAVLKKA